VVLSDDVVGWLTEEMMNDSVRKVAVKGVNQLDSDLVG
jgi:hypothetical protein